MQARSPHLRLTSDQSCSTHPTDTTASKLHQHTITESPSLGQDLQLRVPPDCAPPEGIQSSPEAPVKKSHARKQPEGHIPRPRNAFILFRCDFVAQKKIPASVEPDHRNISRIVGRIWKALSDEDRRPWIEEAKKERERHKRLYPQYRYAPSSATASASGMKERRAQYQKIREGMGMLPVWEVTSQTSSSVPLASQPTRERQEQREEVSQAEMQPQMQIAAVNDDHWNASTRQDTRSSVASHCNTVEGPGDPSLAYDHSWGSSSQRNWSFGGSAERLHLLPPGEAAPVESRQSLNAPSPLPQLMPFDVPVTSFHYDSPDPYPVESTRNLGPFMFVARHYGVNNPDFSGFHFASAHREAPAAALPFADAIAAMGPGDRASRYQQRPYEYKIHPENAFEGHAWTPDQIDIIIQNMRSSSSFERSS